MTVMYKDKEYQIVTPVESLMNSHMISDIINRGDRLAVDVKTNKLTVIPGRPTFHGFYNGAWHELPDSYKEAIRKLGTFQNIKSFTCSSDPQVHQVHPIWKMFKLQLMEYYQRWNK